MKLRSALKIIASAALLLNIVAAILLYGSIRNSQAAANQSFLLTYLCLFGIILFSFILYLLFMGTESGNEEKNSDGIVSAEVKEEVIIQESKDASEKLIDLEDLKKKAEGFIPGKAMDPQQKFSYKNFAEESLSQIAKIFPITEGIFYLRELGSDEFTPKGDYAYFSDKVPSGFKLVHRAGLRGERGLHEPETGGPSGDVPDKGGGADEQVQVRVDLVQDYGVVFFVFPAVGVGGPLDTGF